MDRLLQLGAGGLSGMGQVMVVTGQTPLLTRMLSVYDTASRYECPYDGHS